MTRITENSGVAVQQPSDNPAVSMPQPHLPKGSGSPPPKMGGASLQALGSLTASASQMHTTGASKDAGAAIFASSQVHDIAASIAAASDPGRYKSPVPSVVLSTVPTFEGERLPPTSEETVRVPVEFNPFEEVVTSAIKIVNQNRQYPPVAMAMKQLSRLAPILSGEAVRRSVDDYAKKGSKKVENDLRIHRAKQARGAADE